MSTNDKKKNNDSEKGLPVSSYLPFGWYLKRLRESRGMRSEQVAQYMGMTREEYLKLEYGIRLPDNQEKLELCRLLNESVAKMNEVVLHDRKKVFKEEPLAEGARALSPKLESAWKEVRTKYKEETGHDLTESQRAILGYLKRDLYRLVTPPIPPFPSFLILSAVRQYEDQYTYLHEVKDFVLKGETMAAYIARDLRLGPSLFDSANLFFFQENPSVNLVDCMNRLSFKQFKELYLLEGFGEGIYSNERELPALWLQAHHTTLCVLLARAFKECLPPQVNYNHLEEVLLLQGMGHLALYTCFQPSLRLTDVPESDDIETSVSDAAYNFLSDELFTIILSILHPVASAMLAANRRFPQEVIDALLTHHEHPVKDVSPLCAWVKLLNFLVDIDLPPLKKEDIEGYTSSYPQIKIPPETVYQVLVKVNQDKLNFIERSSTMAAAVSKSVSQYVKDRLQNTGKKTLLAGDPSSRPVTTATLFRAEAFHKAGSVACMASFDGLMRENIAPRENESMKAFLDRVELFYLRLAYLKNPSVKDIAATFKMTETEIRKLLNIK